MANIIYAVDFNSKVDGEPATTEKPPTFPEQKYIA